jgi:Flp pilus assembly protein TadD
MRTVGFVALGLLLLGGGCRKHEAAPKPTIVAEHSASARPSASAPLSVAPSTSAAPLASVALGTRGPSRAPVALDDEGKRAAKAYLTALGEGRKATVAKDYARAEAQFSKCLTLLPQDPRALSERGYARLLDEKLEEAEADLAAAWQGASSASLQLQILHNRMLVARKRGDEKLAASFERSKQQLKSARRLAAGEGCSLETKPSTLEPEHPKTMADALGRMVQSHLKGVEGLKAEELTIGGAVGGAAIPKGASDAELWQLVTSGPPRDGTWALATTAPDAMTVGTHLLISREGKLYLHPKLSLAWQGRCGYSGAAEVSVAGGGPEPLHMVLLNTEMITAYMCEWPDGANPSTCGTRDGVEGTPVQSYCTVASMSEELIVLDSNTFEGMLDVSVNSNGSVDWEGKTVRLLEFQLKSDQVDVNACGTRKSVPYVSDSPP